MLSLSQCLPNRVTLYYNIISEDETPLPPCVLLMDLFSPRVPLKNKNGFLMVSICIKKIKNNILGHA